MNLHNTRVVSCGAAGSKVFTKFLHPNLSKSELGRYHVHFRHPKTSPNQCQSFVYLFADPRNAVLSFFNRRERKHSNHGFAPQAETRQEWTISEHDWVCRHLANLECDRGAVHESWGLEEYLEHTEHDAFRFEEHLDNWLVETQRDVLFVRFETMWTHQAALREVVGQPKSSLPEFVPRAANWRFQDARTQTRLDALYGAYAARLTTLPDVFGRVGGCEIGAIGGPVR